MPDNILPVEPVSSPVQELPDFGNVSYPKPMSFPQRQDVGLASGTSDPVESGFAKLDGMKPDQTAPRFFDWDKNKTSIYANSPHFKELGFDPTLGEGNEMRYAQQQTGWDEFKRGTGGFVAGLGEGVTGMVSNLKNIGSWFTDPTLEVHLSKISLKLLTRNNRSLIITGTSSREKILLYGAG